MSRAFLSRTASFRGRHPRKLHKCCSAATAQATVLENKVVTLDERARLLKLTVEDPINYIRGRRIAPKPAEPTWLDAFETPGQKVTVSLMHNDGSPGRQVSLALACSPTGARSASANLDASIIEVVVEQEGASSELYEAEPGELCEVSSVKGPGFVSPYQPDVTLTSVLEEKRPLLVIAGGYQGMASARAALNWDPLQALATTDVPVLLLYLARSRQSAAFVTDWDAWRTAGAIVLPVYTCDDGSARLADAAASNGSDGETLRGSMDEGESSVLLPEEDRIILHLENMLGPEGKVAELMNGRLRDTATLFAGLSPTEAKVTLRALTAQHVARDLILQC